MPRTTAVLLFAFVAQTCAKEQAMSEDRLTDKVADKLADQLGERAFNALPLPDTDLDDTTVGKSSQLALPQSGQLAVGLPQSGQIALAATRTQLAMSGPLLTPLAPSRIALNAWEQDTCARRAVAAAARQGFGDAANRMCAAQSGRSLATRASTPRQVVHASASEERSYVMIKPDGVQRGLVGEIISRFERKGFYLKGLKMFQTPEDLAKEHYKDLSEKPFFGDLVEYICSGPVVCMVWEGKGVIKSARKLIGATNPLEAEPGTIRGDYAVETGRNVIHGSDSPENGEREIGIWFESGAGMVDWTPRMEPWLREIDC